MAFKQGAKVLVEVRRSVLGGGNGTREGPEMEKSWDLLGNFTKAFSGWYPMSTAVHVVCVCVCVDWKG